VSSLRRNVLPGFGLSLGTTLLYLTLIVLIPLAALILKSSQSGVAGFVELLTSRRVQASLRITVFAAALATLFNAVYGLLMAWILVRYRFIGRAVLDALMDLPFALPTAVAGIALTALFAKNGWYGSLLEPHGIKIAYTVWGVAVAMAFTSAPFIVRTVQPVLQDLRPEVEEVAATLGARPTHIFRRVIFPSILPAYLGGCALAFARSLGEFGAVIFIAGNLPFKTEIAALLIFIRLEEFDYPGAAALSLLLLVISMLTLVLSNLVQRRFLERGG
jgi:sulfate transport system permease protein